MSLLVVRLVFPLEYLLYFMHFSMAVVFHPRHQWLNGTIHLCHTSFDLPEEQLDEVRVRFAVDAPFLLLFF